jgi:hypothetical protein
MNIIDIQDNLKNFSEDQLINEMQRPSGNAPQFLVLSEITRRKRMRDDFNMRKAANEPTVAQEAVASAGVPAQGIMGMSEAMAPKAAMAQGGIGSVMSQPMKSQMPQPTSMPQDGIMAMSSGGYTRPRQKIEERRMKSGKIGLFQGNTFLGTKKDIDGDGESLASQIGFGQKGSIVESIKDALGFAEGGVIKAQNGLPLGLRQKNPGNIRPGAGFIGETGADGGYATFGSDDEGLRAIQRLLMTYGDKYGVNTLRGFANRYAPPSDNNPTGNYIDFLADKTGIDPDAEINLAKQGSAIIPAVIGFEQGQQPYSQAQIDRAIRAAGTEDPTEVSSILAEPLDDDKPSMLSNIASELNPFSVKTAAASAFTPTGNTQVMLDDDPDAKPSQAEIRAMVQDKYRESGLGSFKGTVPNLGGSGIVVENIDDLAKATARNAQTAQDQVITSVEQGASASEVESLIEDAQEKSNKAALVQAQSKDMSAAADEGASIKANTEAKQLLDEADALEATAKNSPDAIAEQLINEAQKKREEAGKLVQSAQNLSASATQKSEEATDQRSNLTPDAGTVKPSTEKSDETETKKEKAADADSNKPIYSSQAAGSVSSLESEIMALQDRMKKSAEQDKWLSLAQAGLSLMSSTNPTLLGALGEAGISGLSAMKEAESRYQEGVVDLINARAKLAENKTGMTAANAVSRLNKITDLLVKGVDELGGPLSPETRSRLENESRYLRKDILKYPDYTTGANTPPPAS